MKNKNILTIALVAVTANIALTGCDAMNQKTAIDERNTPPRAYVAAPGSDIASAENPLMLVNTNNRTLNNASPANLSSIETAAGPGATATQPAPVVIQGGYLDPESMAGSRIRN